MVAARLADGEGETTSDRGGPEDPWVGCLEAKAPDAAMPRHGRFPKDHPIASEDHVIRGRVLVTIQTRKLPTSYNPGAVQPDQMATDAPNSRSPERRAAHDAA